MCVVQEEIFPQDLKDRNQPGKVNRIEHRLISELSIDAEIHVFLRLNISFDWSAIGLEVWLDWR